MRQVTSENMWQDISWNGLSFQLPASWQPAVIHPAYLLFEQENRPAFEIKWQQSQGRFSAEKILNHIRNTLKDGTRLARWDIPPDLLQLLAGYTVTGFQLQQKNSASHGLVLYCPACKRTTLLQWYIDTAREEITLTRLLGSFSDHNDGPKQIWTMYDITAHLPAEAVLLSHEFLPGRYTLCFDIAGTAVTLYRFKPAKILLNKKSMGQFGELLLNRPPVEEGNGWASWLYRAEGLELLLAKARRNPQWQWMRLWHAPEHNVILGVKAEGKRLAESGLLENICENLTSLQSL